MTFSSFESTPFGSQVNTTVSATSSTFSMRSRSPNGDPITVLREWDNAKVALVICDMWDTTQCVSAARRVVEMAPRVNELAARLRREGALIVHAPTGCMDSYAGTAARERARQAPPVQSPVPVDWHDWDASRESPLPDALADDTPCSCEPGEPCTAGGPPYPWTHQIETIEISTTDAVTDDGEELLALLEERAIEDVVVVGVHANRCVLGRPYGIRQCPTITSDQLVGGAPFQFRSTAASQA